MKPVPSESVNGIRTFKEQVAPAFPSSCCNPSLIQRSLSERYRDDAHVPSSKVRDEVPRGPAKNSRMVVTLVSRMVSMLCDGHRKARARAWCRVRTKAVV